MHQKHEAILAEHGTEIKSLHRGQDEMRGDIKTILSTVQSNAASNALSNRPNLGLIATSAGVMVAFGIGFMTLVILPMNESADKSGLKQDEVNRTSTDNLNQLSARMFNLATESARKEGELQGELNSQGRQIRDIDNAGPRGAIN